MLNPSVEVRERDGILLAEFWDCLRLDPNPVRNLRIAYERHAQVGGKPAVVVDLKGVGFAGSAALSGFVSLRKLGARVVFYNIEATVREVFRVSALEPLFHFAEDLESAMQIASGTAAEASSDSAETVGKRSTVAATRTKAAPPPLRRSRRVTRPESES